MPISYIGEFEQMVLLAILQGEDGAYAIDVRGELERCAHRAVSRGALYRTFDRLRLKGYLEWDVEETDADGKRGGYPMRRFRVTDLGLEALRVSRSALLELWDGVGTVLNEP